MHHPRRSRPLPARSLVATLAVLVLAALLALAAARPAGACACGIAFGSKVGTERAVISLQGGVEEIVLGLDLAAPDADASSPRRPAVLLPVPATPTVTALTEEEGRVFTELERATATVPNPSSGDGDGAAAAPKAASGVSVLSRERIGGYDVTRLRAGDASALRSWLNRGGYATPAAAEPVLRDYVRRRWAFVAIRLADPVRGATRTLSPLRVSFASDSLVYPLKLSSVSPRAVDVQLYVAGDHRVIADGFDTFFAGTVDGLRPALSAPVRALLRGPYLTRLKIASPDASRITDDVRPRQAVSDRLFRSSQDYPFETIANFALGPLPKDLPSARATEPFDGPGGKAWLILFPAIALSVLAVFGVLRLRERLRTRG